MSAAHKSAGDIFDAAIQLPRDQQAAYVAQASGDDAQLRQRVEALLRAHEAAGPFMESRQLGTERPAPTREIPPRESAPERIGRYKLLQKIGEGGFGVVYMAEQTEPVRRRVALKIIKLGMDTRQVVARFEAERQALALMDHPNIAKVLDAGATDNGRPYFVMELVRGIKITDYCDQHKVRLSDRLNLFLQICNAIQHAHQKGIIHRDLKPSNILVTMHDGVPVPKVIDFGIAKATEQPLTDKTLFTAYEQFMGTPAYMSPEQAEMSGLDIDTRSDIYSLGVLLYELLTGRPPFDGKKLLERGVEEARRTIREVEPPRPSTRLSTLVKGDLNTVASQRSADGPKLVNLVRGDLDWIVMKCIEKDRTRRYETANALALDLKRCLSNEPIVARPPSNLYRFRKMVRRNKVAFAALGAVAGVIVAGAGVSTWQAFRATAAEKQARQQALAEQRAREAEAQQRLRAERERARAEQALAQARFEEGKAWLERAQSYLEERNPFYAKLMAGRAIGFRGFGREKLTQKQREELLELLPSASTEAWEAEMIVRASDDYVPIWHRPLLRNQAGRVSQSAIGVAFSPDGRLLASAHGSGATNVGLWDPANGAIKATMEGHSKTIWFLEFSPDGRLLATASHDGTIRVWDVVTHKTLLTLEGYSPDLQIVAFSPDGKLLAACGDGVRTIRLWRLPGGRLETELVKDAATGYLAMAFSPDGAVLAAGCYDGTIELWNTETLMLQTRWRAHSSIVRALDFSLDGRFLASGCVDATLKLWVMPAAQLRTELPGHLAEITSVRFNPRGDLLASYDHNGVLRLWAVHQGAAKTTLRSSTPRVWGSLSFSPDGQLLAAGGLLQLFELSSGHLEAESVAHLQGVKKVAVSRDGRLLASAGYDQTVALWDLPDLEPTGERLRHPHDVRAVDFSPDGRWLASGCQDGIVRLWRVAGGRLEAELRGHKGYVRALAFSPDGKLLASVSYDDDAVRLWDVAQRKACEAILKGAPRLDDLAFSSDGRLLAAVGENLELSYSWVKVWDLATQQMKADIRLLGSPYSVTFSPDGGLVAAGEYQGMIELWEVESGKLKARLAGHSDQVRGLDFSPDGKLLVSASFDHTIGIWAVGSAQLLGRLRGHSAGVESAVFTPDGLRVISGSADTTIRIWSLTAALNRELDYASFMNWFDMEGRNVTWRALKRGADSSAAKDMPMKSFTGKSLVTVLQSGVPEEELDRTLFGRFLRAGNLSSARLLVERHGQQQWKRESETLGRAYLREAKTVLDYESYRLAAQYAERARAFLPEKAADAWSITALAEHGLKRWPEAMTAIDQAIALDSSNAELWHEKALILEQQAEKPAARDALTRAINLAFKADAKDSRLEMWRKRLQQLEQ